MNLDLQGCTAAMLALEAALEAVFAAAREGMTAEEIDAILVRELAARGAELIRQSNTPFVVDENGAPPKRRLDRIPLQRGKLFGLDNSVRRNGHCADLGRYGYFGALPMTLRHEHTTVLEHQETVARAVKPGRLMADIFSDCPRDLPFEIHRIGDEPSMAPFCGNAVKGVVDAMAQATTERLIFEPGQVVCVEVWAGMKGGIEDMYRVEADGIVRISSLPRSIREIP